MPTLVGYNNEHTADGFTVIAVEAGEPVDLVSQFADSFQMTFPVWLDPNDQAYVAFRYPGLPTSYVIDRDNKVRLVWMGAISQEALEKYLTPLLED